MQHRKGEADKTRFRAQRFFNVGDNYYFTTREGKNIGPFPNMQAAERGSSLYIQCIGNEEEMGIYASKIAMQGLWASTNYW